MLGASTQDRHAESDRRLGGFGRWGTVVEVSGRRCRVRLSEDLETGFIPWFGFASGSFRVWRAPSVGEQGLVLFPEADIAQGLFLPGVYSDDFPAPPASPGQLVVEMQPESAERGGLRIVLGRQGDRPLAVLRCKLPDDEDAALQSAIVIRDDHVSLLSGSRYLNIGKLGSYVLSPFVELGGPGPFSTDDAEALAL